MHVLLSRFVSHEGITALACYMVRNNNRAGGRCSCTGFQDSPLGGTEHVEEREGVQPNPRVAQIKWLKDG